MNEVVPLWVLFIAFYVVGFIVGLSCGVLL